METADMDVDAVDTTVPIRNRIKFEVEIYGDTICPWCFLGKKSLDKAIKTYAAKYPEDVFDIVWKPFILWPTAEASAYGKKAPILGMVGPIRAPAVFDRLAEAGAQYGIHFNWEGLVGNSADANKLVVLAYEIDQKLRRAQQNHHSQQQREQTASQFSSTPPQLYDTPSPEQPPTTTAEAAAATKEFTRSPGTISPPPSSPPSPVFTHHPGPQSSLSLPILNQSQHAFLEALFHQTFTQGFDVSNRTFLINLALSIDPPLAKSPSEIVAYLDSDEANARVGLESPLASARQQGRQQQEKVNNNREEEKENGEERSKENPYHTEKKDLKALINGVPSVVVQGRYRVGGMQKSEVYLAVFEKVREGFLLAGKEQEHEHGVESELGKESKEAHEGGCFSSS